MAKLIAGTALFTGTAGSLAAAEVIGRNANIGLPPSAEWSSVVNFRPGDGETVTINPPRFSWSYTPDPRNSNADTTARMFQFQVADNAQFLAPVVDIRTACNFYNFLAPFASNKLFWRVGYAGLTGPVTEWSAVRQFTVGSGAIPWDRSMLAKTDYLSAKGAHPHILFNASNRAAVASYLSKNYASNWASIISIADQTIAAAWWPSTMPASGVMSEEVWATRIGNVAFAWQMTRDPKYDDAGAALVVLANRYVATNGPNLDFISAANFASELRSLAMGYDWLYDVMDATQRATVLNALSLRCHFITNHYAIWYRTTNGNLSVDNTSLAKKGESHGFYNFYTTIEAALAGYNESTDCREMFDLGINYMIGVTYTFGANGCPNQGRDYGYDAHFNNADMLPTHMRLQISFPEAQFQLNPYWNNAVDWWDRLLPVAYTQLNEAWGDGNVTESSWARFGRKLATFTGSGVAWQHRQNQRALPPYSDYPEAEIYPTFPFLYHFAVPVPVDSPTGGRIFPVDGWVTSSSLPTNSRKGFEDGVGFILQARPYGCEGGHSHFNDLSFELWAYGANLTDAGASMTPYAKIPYCHYSLMVNGLGTVQPNGSPVVPYYSRFLAYKETEGYTYVAADGLNAYPRTNFTPWGYLMPASFSQFHAGAPLAALEKVNRHILFMRKKYFVIYDDMASAQESTFTWLYHVLPNTVTLDAGNAAFTYTVPNSSGGNVKVQVVHITDPAALQVRHLTGLEVASNPITGENYYASGDNIHRASALWISNKSPIKQFHFLTVIYPSKPDSPMVQIQRLDDFTVKVINGSEEDVISFDGDTTQAATVIVDVSAIDGVPAAQSTWEGLQEDPIKDQIK
jgi:hypothetical protein